MCLSTLTLPILKSLIFVVSRTKYEKKKETKKKDRLLLETEESESGVSIY